MSRFDECLAFVLKWEGGYSNDSDDAGGATNKGITQAVYDEYRVGYGVGRQPVSGISAKEVSDIYRRKYWARICGDRLPKGLDLAVFDAAVNVGVVQSSKFLQRALGVDDDGIIGDKTISAVLSDEIAGLLSQTTADVIDQRRDFYEALVERKPSQRKFLNGWLNRVNALAKEVLNGS